MQVLVQRGAHKNGFDYETTKSDTVRFVAKCRGTKEGCNWYMLKLKNPDSISYVEVDVAKKFKYICTMCNMDY